MSDAGGAGGSRYEGGSAGGSMHTGSAHGGGSVQAGSRYGGSGSDSAQEGVRARWSAGAPSPAATDRSAEEIIQELLASASGTGA